MDKETDNRQHPRHEIPLEGTLHYRGDTTPCRVRNISAGGALIEVETNIRPGHAVDIELPELGKMAGRVTRVIWKLAGISLDKDEAQDDAFIVGGLERESKDTQSP